MFLPERLGSYTFRSDCFLLLPHVNEASRLNPQAQTTRARAIWSSHPP